MTTTLIYLILGATWLFGLVVQKRLKATYARHSAVANSSGLPGAAVARHILDANGLENVHLEVAPGKLTDHYDPRTLAIRLSPDDARDASLLGMLAYGGSILFQFVTLAVEFDASRRALAQLKSLGITRREKEEDETKATLRAAAMTYVAGAASAAGFLLIVGADVLRAFGALPRRRAV